MRTGDQTGDRSGDQTGDQWRILVAGGAGCLGAALSERFLGAGHEVLVIDNFATGRREALPAAYPGLTVVEGSIADSDLVDDWFRRFRPTHVVHSAAAYKDPLDWREDARTNVDGTVNLILAAKQAGSRRLVNFQTALCYGRPRRVPIPVDHPLDPFTSYGISKTAGEQYLAASDLPWVSLRLANVTGPRLAIGPIPTFYKRLAAGQACFCSDTVRDFLAMDDFLAAVDTVLADDAPTGVFNISTGEGHTIKEIFDLVAEHLNVALDRPVPVVPPAADDVPAVVLDPTEAEAWLGWRAKVDFVETIRGTLRWYDRYGVGAIHSHLKPAEAAAS